MREEARVHKEVNKVENMENPNTIWTMGSLLFVMRGEGEELTVLQLVLPVDIRGIHNRLVWLFRLFFAQLPHICSSVCRWGEVWSGDSPSPCFLVKLLSV